MSTSLSSYSIAPSSRALLTKAGFQTYEEVRTLKPSQLAHELGCSASQAHAILNELNPAAISKEAILANANSATSSSSATASASAASPSSSSEEKKDDANAKTQILSAAKQESNTWGESGLDLMRRRAGWRPITTGCAAFDEIMSGGAPIGQITEFCGVPGAGKTQLCIQLACNIQMPKKFVQTSWEGQAIYIDTEGSFLPARAESIAGGVVESIQQYSESARLKSQAKAGGRYSPGPLPDVDSILKGIHVYRAYDYIEQLAIIKSLPSFLREHPSVHLLIIDSVAFHFRRGFNDMGLRSRMLTGMAQELLYLANQFQLAVVLTNQVTTRVESAGVNASNSALAPALGESWAHSCTHRIMLDYEGADRVARLLKSPSMKSGRAFYDIKERGITQLAQPQQQHQQQAPAQAQHQRPTQQHQLPPQQPQQQQQQYQQHQQPPQAASSTMSAVHQRSPHQPTSMQQLQQQPQLHPQASSTANQVAGAKRGFQQ